MGIVVAKVAVVVTKRIMRMRKRIAKMKRTGKKRFGQKQNIKVSKKMIQM